MKIASSLYLRILGILAFSLPICSRYISIANAQVTCSSEITYKWKRSVGTEESTVKFDRLKMEASDEAASKQKLVEQSKSVLKSAREACQKEHENLSGCYAVKYGALANLLKATDFASRKPIEEAIQADCKRQQGTCTEPISGEIICQVPVAAAEAAAAGGKEDPKAKKKK